MILGIDILKFYRMNDYVTLPKMATPDSACFDFHANFRGVAMVSCRSEQNETYEVDPMLSSTDTNNSFILRPNHRALIPTGLIADIPSGYSIRIHPRSGLAFKSGVALSNQEGIVDADYKEQIFISMINFSMIPKKIIHNDRIAQGELVSLSNYWIREIDEAPSRTTNRVGGFGSTGE